MVGASIFALKVEERSGLIPRRYDDASLQNGALVNLPLFRFTDADLEQFFHCF